MKYTINPDLIEKISNNILIVISLEDKNVHCSNEIGILIWQNLKDGKSTKEILENITSNYDIDVTTAEKDMEEFVAELLKNNLISNK
ncbi:PqqD family protein [bacterium]|nr:PqqD family protein [bacterium]